ncbi:MAG TPA: DUF481 domain-containing protein [Gemmatimonadales bacterium]
MLPRPVLLVAALAVWPAVASAQKTDVVTMPNGDKITGEVKSLARGKLDYSTDDLGRLSIEWIKVARIVSMHYFDVEVSSGRRYYGRLAEPSADGVIVVKGLQADTLPVQSVVAIDPLNAGFFQRMKAYLDVGFSLAKANTATTLNVSAETEYRGPKFGATLGFDLYAQGQDGTPATTRSAVSFEGNRFLPNRWNAAAIARLEQNDELNLDYRFTGGVGGGRVLKQSNRAEVDAAMGLVVTREQFLPQEGDSAGLGEPTLNLEGLAYFGWDAFRFDTPKLDFSTSLTLYPSLSNLGRVRGDFEVRLKYEVFKDFHFGINFTDTFDSRPPDPNASRNDYVTSLTIGWSYRR